MQSVLYIYTHRHIDKRAFCCFYFTILLHICFVYFKETFFSWILFQFQFNFCCERTRWNIHTRAAFILRGLFLFIYFRLCMILDISVSFFLSSHFNALDFLLMARNKTWKENNKKKVYNNLKWILTIIFIVYCFCVQLHLCFCIFGSVNYWIICLKCQWPITVLITNKRWLILKIIS